MKRELRPKATSLPQKSIDATIAGSYIGVPTRNGHMTNSAASAAIFKTRLSKESNISASSLTI
ncbi:hypothetical protein N7467_006165 [Penicillium canescens]|nr:hypothetical protein N7467_006165 [Penicillium canescens]